MAYLHLNHWSHRAGNRGLRGETHRFHRHRVGRLLFDETTLENRSKVDHQQKNTIRGGEVMGFLKKVKEKTEETAKKGVDVGKDVAGKAVDVGKDVGEKGVELGKKGLAKGVKVGKKKGDTIKEKVKS